MRYEPVITAAELLEIRNEFDITQEKFGEMLGVGRETIWKWENNQRVAKGAIALLARIKLKLFRLGVPLNDLMSRDVENKWIDKYFSM